MLIVYTVVIACTVFGVFSSWWRRITAGEWTADKSVRAARVAWQCACAECTLKDETDIIRGFANYYILNPALSVKV